MKKIVVILITILLSIAIYGCSSSGGTKSGSTEDNENSKENKPTLTFAVTPWTSTVPPTKIAEKILKDMGYKVKEKETQLGVAFAGLSTGDVNIFMDYWEPQHEQYFKRYSDSVNKISKSYGHADRGFVVPKYMKDVNDVGDLKGKENKVDNKVLSIEDSDPVVKELSKVIDKYDLDLEMATSSESAMVAAAQKKLREKKPFVMIGWRPHSMFNKLDVKLLTNKKTPKLGLSKSSTVYVVGHKGLKKDAPKAYKFLNNWSISIDDVEKMISKIDDGKDPDDVTQKWIDNHQDKIKKMTGEDSE